MSISNDELTRKVETIVRQVIDSLYPATNDSAIPLGISARHLHICQEDLEILFGKGAQLTKMRDLKQPGEFAANETVTVVGPNRRMFEKVRILGPTRPQTQVEMAYSDGRFLGIELPHRISGNIKGSAPITLIGPEGVLRLTEGAIRAMRHLHCSPQDAARLGIRDGEEVSVRTEGESSVTFNHVVVRIKDKLKLEMHVDTDEANAAGLTAANAFGYLVKEQK
ncbi:MAG TPA: phosphate propanoyltransferase [bacterium]|jgi:propanediol utilization protein|nr:phosphate propanoyltransferase [bacterium]HNT66623.1 phosphate propanoyltransferase [bacterium]HOX86705.1 phosphate propanoyltransferase [bacterium]HPG46105.1 phosphate propanoyltransferase [bacterium]HPM98267.1 phosphate propanoyltransferase [bacterium]